MKGVGDKITLPSQAITQIQQGNQKFYGRGKPKRIQCHQTSFRTNANGNSLGNKHKRRKHTKYKNEANKGIVIGRYIQICTLTINGLAAPKKKKKKIADWLNGYKTQPVYMLSIRDQFQTQ